jgi:hypothetical protein
MQPESSDGFASVGTILPEEGAALLPGGSFRFCLIQIEIQHKFACDLATNGIVSG